MLIIATDMVLVLEITLVLVNQVGQVQIVPHLTLIVLMLVIAMDEELALEIMFVLVNQVGQV